MNFCLKLFNRTWKTLYKILETCVSPVMQFLCMDALMGITFWYLHALGDPRATKYRGPKPDSAFKGDLVASCNCSELRALRDTSYSLKHGRLTRPNRIINSASQVTEGANSLGYFQAGEAVNRPNAPERLLPMTVLALHQCAGS